MAVLSDLCAARDRPGAVSARAALDSLREATPRSAARDLPPEAVCIECDRPASRLCQECQYDWESAGTLCSQHAKIHPHEEYGEPIEIVNAPRLGLCGYTGPADPLLTRGRRSGGG
jgi:hypothetical protein